LRSIAVIIAAILAEFIPSVTSEEADASAALVVSVLIALSLIPLFGGIVQTFGALKQVNELLKEEELEYGVIEYDEEEEGNWV
jgi:Co/Zn/Cd efflux system component